MPIRVRYLVVGLAAVVAGVVLLLVLRGDNAEKGETVLGMQGRGFPLRGSLAADDEAIAGAVSAWRERAKDDEDEDEDDDTTASRRPDEDQDVVVLWAGRVGDRRDVVMLEGGELVVAMQRSPTRDWYASGESSRDRNGTPGMPVGASRFIVVPTGARWRSVNASESSGLSVVGDGLFSNSSEQDGFVLPESGAGSGDDEVSIYVADVGGRLMSREAFAELEDALAAGYARALWIATNEAQRQVTYRVKLLPTVPVELLGPQSLEIVWTGRLLNYPQAAIIVQGRGHRQSIALGFTAPPGENVSSDDFIVGSQVLGFGDQARSGDNESDTAVAGEYVEFAGKPYLVLAGIGVETLHALVGDREIRRRAPVAVIDARPLSERGESPDTIMYGRTADGDVIAPLNR